MRNIIEEYNRKCITQPLGTKERAECMKKLSDSIILQCIEDLWDRASMKQSAKFFSQWDFSICANIAGMDICDQVKLLNCAISRILTLHRGRSIRSRRCVPSLFKQNTMAGLRADSEPRGHHGLLC